MHQQTCFYSRIGILKNIVFTLVSFQVSEQKVNEVKDSVPEDSMGIDKGKGKAKPKPKPKPKPSMFRKPTSRIQQVRTNRYFRLLYINPLK